MRPRPRCKAQVWPDIVSRATANAFLLPVAISRLRREAGLLGSSGEAAFNSAGYRADLTCACE